MVVSLLSQLCNKQPPAQKPLVWPRGTDTHAQKSSTVSTLVTRCRLSCQARLRSFLKNHRAHLIGKRKQRHPPCPPPAAPGLTGRSLPFKDKIGDLGAQTHPHAQGDWSYPERLRKE